MPYPDDRELIFASGYGRTFRISALRRVLRLIVEHHELTVAERHLRVRAPVVIRELNLENAGTQALDHGTDLSAAQAVVR
jgi:hypothetical protein